MLTRTHRDRPCDKGNERFLLDRVQAPVQEQVGKESHFMQEEGDKTNDQNPDCRTELQRHKPIQPAFFAKQPATLVPLLPFCQRQSQIPAIAASADE